MIWEMMTVALKLAERGYYSGYKTVLEITHEGKTMKLSSTTGAVFEYDVSSDDGGAPATCTFTLFNIAPVHLNRIHQHDHVVIYTGPSDLYGMLTQGNISKIAPEQIDGRDKSTVITFVEGPDYSKDKRLYSKFNGSKLVKKTVTAGKTKVSYTKKQVKKLNVTFKKGVTAKQIIGRIESEAKIKIAVLHLKKNHVYKKGYTLSKKPFDALKSIAKDCGSSIYYRKGQLVIDDGQQPNPYNEHLFLSLNTGLLEEPTSDDSDDGKATWTMTCLEDPRLSAGSAITIKSANLNGTHRVKSVEHTHDRESYQMEVVVYD